MSDLDEDGVLSELKKEDLNEEKLAELYDEVINDLREDREEASILIDQLRNLVVNEGEVTPEIVLSFISAVRLRSDVTDKKSKIADLRTKLKLKKMPSASSSNKRLGATNPGSPKANVTDIIKNMRGGSNG